MNTLGIRQVLLLFSLCADADVHIIPDLLGSTCWSTKEIPTDTIQPITHTKPDRHIDSAHVGTSEPRLLNLPWRVDTTLYWARILRVVYLRSAKHGRATFAVHIQGLTSSRSATTCRTPPSLPKLLFPVPKDKLDASRGIFLRPLVLVLITSFPIVSVVFNLRPARETPVCGRRYRS